MTAVLDGPARIRLIGYQQGPDGYVRYGGDTGGEWEDYLYLNAHGGVGSGKTRGGAYRMLAYMLSWPNSFGIVLAPTKDIFRTSTMVVIREVFAQAGLYEGRDWTYNKTESLFTLLGTGAQAWCSSTEEPEHIIGQSAAWAWLDEPGRMPQVAFQNIQKRLRQQGYPHQCWLSGTPTGKVHWTHAYFYPDKTDPETFGDLSIAPSWEGDGDGDIWRITRFDDGGVVRSHYKSWHARTIDNPFGGRELYAQLVAVYGEDSPLARQELGGEYQLVEGLTYDQFVADRHVLAESAWPTRPDRVVAGIDFGYAAPAAIVVEGLDRANRRYLLDEFYQAGCAEEVLISHAKRLRQQYGIKWMFGDPADPRWMAAMRHAGLPMIKANKRRGAGHDPSFGIGLCAWALTQRDGEGGQGFYVSPRCRRWRIEIENYVREETRLNKNPSELPRQKGDHAMDAWRYAEMGIARLWDRPDRHGARPPTLLRMEMAA